MGKRSTKRRFTRVPRPATELGRQGGAAQQVSERSKVLRRCPPDSNKIRLQTILERCESIRNNEKNYSVDSIKQTVHLAFHGLFSLLKILFTISKQYF